MQLQFTCMVDVFLPFLLHSVHKRYPHRVAWPYIQGRLPQRGHVFFCVCNGLWHTLSCFLFPACQEKHALWTISLTQRWETSFWPSFPFDESFKYDSMKRIIENKISISWHFQRHQLHMRLSDPICQILNLWSQAFATIFLCSQCSKSSRKSNYASLLRSESVLIT